jgi:phosphopantothenoylcysteine decarboxylase/phosphopantothenate--cysteine ligase
MGYELAKSAIAGGHKATLITAPTNLDTPKGAGVVNVESASDMFGAVKHKFGGCDCLIMTAAVSDYTTVKKSKIKIKKSNRNLIIKLKRTDDILQWAGTHKRQNQIVIGFALEDRDIKSSAERKMREKSLDMIVANTPAAIGSRQCGVWVKKSGCQWRRFAKASKKQAAGRLIRMIEKSIWVD